MSEKFGSTLNNAAELLLKAKELNLVPYGISFNVGSQARNKDAWARGIKDVATIMNKLLKSGIKIQVINLGGGFPHNYEKRKKFPFFGEIASSIDAACKFLPYKVNFIAEPGRDWWLMHLCY